MIRFFFAGWADEDERWRTGELEHIAKLKPIEIRHATSEKAVRVVAVDAARK